MKKSIFGCEKGASAVEFAIVSPLLILFLLSAVYLGIYLSLLHSVQQLSADAARASIAGLDTAERQQLSADYVKSEAETYFLLDSDRVGVVAGQAKNNPSAFEVTINYDAANILGWYPHQLDTSGYHDLTGT